MVCSRCPRDGRHYEVLLKKKCIRKLKRNVWENKVKWKLLMKADLHYRLKILRKFFHKWIIYLNRAFVRRLNVSLAVSFYDELVLTKGLTALKRNVEINRSLVEDLKRKRDLKLTRLTWHRWKRYTLMRLKVKKVKFLADKIRNERLIIKVLYLWACRFREKMCHKEAVEKAEAKHSTELLKKCLSYWRVYTRQRIERNRSKGLSVEFHNSLIKKRSFVLWKSHVDRMKIIGCCVETVKTIWENHTIESYLEIWRTAYEKISEKKDRENEGMAVTFYNDKMRKKCLSRLHAAMTSGKVMKAKMTEFDRRLEVMYIRFYIGLWARKRKEKLQWDELKSKADDWRSGYLMELLLEKLTEKYDEKMEERERVLNVAEYYHGRIIQNSFSKWRELTIRRITKRDLTRSSNEMYEKNLKKKTLEKMRQFAFIRWQKKMSIAYRKNLLLERALTQWKNFLDERRKINTRVEEFKREQNWKIVTRALSTWKDRIQANNENVTSACTFYKTTLQWRVFNAWREHHGTVKAKKLFYHRNSSTIQNVIIRNYLYLWQDLLFRRQELNGKVAVARSNMETKLKGRVFSAWLRFVSKLKDLRQTEDLFPELKSGILLEVYVFRLLDRLQCVNSLKRKEGLAENIQKKFVKSKYLKRWLSFVWWKKETVFRCICDDEEYDNSCRSRLDSSEPFVHREKFSRRQPVIPYYMRAECNFEELNGNTKRSLPFFVLPES
ncbi:hypothetical protein RUM43_005849 [Polyplax serrata]|uniref:Sfi1 spindle body domain-containing protein n=1 Tax=Polyplax serrata TaxID=468196 RepID=A0AAN8PBT1_POLSC